MMNLYKYGILRHSQSDVFKHNLFTDETKTVFFNGLGNHFVISLVQKNIDFRWNCRSIDTEIKHVLVVNDNLCPIDSAVLGQITLGENYLVSNYSLRLDFTEIINLEEQKYLMESLKNHLIPFISLELDIVINSISNNLWGNLGETAHI